MPNPFASDQFPLSSKYNPEWIKAGVSGGANPLWMTEWLCRELNLQPGMRVVDLGCGRAISSIFLHKEYGVQVWAVDMLFSPSENFERIKDAGVEDHVFPLRADARLLPFANAFFDVIISIDSFFYFGTDDLYLENITRMLKPGGQLGIAGAGLMHEFNGQVPEHLEQWWTTDLWCLHSAAWWQQHWQRTGIVDIEVADHLDESWRLWLQGHEAIAPDNTVEIEAIKTDAGRCMAYVRVIARKQLHIKGQEPLLFIATQYNKHQLFREE